VGALLGVSKVIDTFNEWVGKLIMWLVLGAVLISAGNAIMRKAFDVGSNAYLEIQWYLFAAVFMLGSGYVFLKNAHVRIDFVSSKLSKRTNAIIDILGIVVFTIPLSLILINLSWPVFARAWVSGEMSQNAGGLIRWPVFLLVPVGFGFLASQALSELIKRAAFLTGHRSEPFSVEHDKTEEDLLLEELAANAEQKALGNYERMPITLHQKSELPDAAGGGGKGGQGGKPR
jgi:TRAP-type mannitol/chloroaromatic compound transport system permease small subunit